MNETKPKRPWRPMSELTEYYFGRSILVWVPFNRCQFCVFTENGRTFYHWGLLGLLASEHSRLKTKVTAWRPMPRSPVFAKAKANGR